MFPRSDAAAQKCKVTNRCYQFVVGTVGTCLGDKYRTQQKSTISREYLLGNPVTLHHTMFWSFGSEVCLVSQRSWSFVNCENPDFFIMFTNLVCRVSGCIVESR